MDVYKYQLGTLCLLLLPLSVAGQEWSKQDSLRLQQTLNSEQEIRINKEFVKKTEQNMLYHTKSFVDFDPTLPTLKSTIISLKLPFHTHNIFRQTNSTFLPTYSRLKINKNFTLHSKSNFSESSNHFHIQTQMDYKLSKKWFLNIYGEQNLDTRRYRGLSSEAIPTTLGSDIVLK
ncbi:DUF4858 domain-containing protein [Bacteroides thetaiotaomicron]|nr:DUF4858 domain-containing protein [Bacteroides thetaiotaomicron]